VGIRPSLRASDTAPIIEDALTPRFRVRERRLQKLRLQVAERLLCVRDLES